MSQTALLEPSFADAAAAIEAATELPQQTRSHWLCSLRQIANMIGRPMANVAARWTASHFALHHARVAANPKTLANHKSNVRRALEWFGKKEQVPRHGMALTPEWEVLRNKLPDRRARCLLSGLMRYSSARQIAPASVGEGALDDYMRYRAEMTALPADATARRAIVRAWNGCIGVVQGWPARRLIEPPVKTMEGPPWETFPEGLKADVEVHLNGLAQIRRSAGRRR